ncbi:hypothetical protein IFR04_008499 [Cadophora malorum]|uniref:Trichothecene biosynthesis protein n=1 Tax=Cadophora malorum TaxID=108018 RepID=A0A8H7TEU8_9HELO|nr:hypothetical protein IFR04_008499 [Cadophora malorum]
MRSSLKALFASFELFLAVAASPTHKRSVCPQVSGDIFFNNQFQLYPAYYRWDSQRCVLYLSAIYNATVVVWDPYTSVIQRVISFPGLSHAGSAVSDKRLSGLLIDPTNNILSGVVEAEEFFLTGGNDVSGDNFVVKVDLNTFEVINEVNLTATTKGQYGAFLDLDNGIDDGIYVNGGYPSSLLRVDSNNEVTPYYVSEPTTAPREFGFGGVVLFENKLIANDNAHSELVSFTLGGAYGTPVVIPQEGNHRNFSAGSALSFPMRYGGKVLLQAETDNEQKTTGVSVFVSMDCWNTAKFVGFLESVDRKLQPASVAISQTTARDVGDRIYSSVLFYDNTANPSMAGNRSDFALRDITDSVDALLLSAGQAIW